MSAAVPAVPRDVEPVRARARAAVLLHPLRLRILTHAAAPVSASEIAARLGLARQKVNYHVRQLARAGFLRRAGRRRKRNMVEQRYVATARGYVLTPDVLGPLAPDRGRIADRMSAAHLLALAAQVQSEVAAVEHRAGRAGKRFATLSLAADVRFTSAEQRARFARALEDAVVHVIATHASPATDARGGPSRGRPYRLIVGCYPAPPAGAAQEKR